MSQVVSVKFCGLRRFEDVEAACELGAEYIAFNFYPPSPRAVIPSQAARLARAMKSSMPPARVGLLVDADDVLLDDIVRTVPLEYLQFHGNETPERVAEVSARYDLPVIKALAVSNQEDLGRIESYTGAADQVLIDAKPSHDAPLPGGNGLSFDWRILRGYQMPEKWMLAGGLTPDNVAEAITCTRAPQVDVSSGIESSPGVKDPRKMAAFMRAVQFARNSHQ